MRIGRSIIRALCKTGAEVRKSICRANNQRREIAVEKIGRKETAGRVSPPWGKAKAQPAVPSTD
jgi:hypothetical protein